MSKNTCPLTTSFKQKALSELPAVLKGDWRKDGPRNVRSAKGVTSKILPGINLKPLTTLPEALSKFKFTIDTPVARRSIQPSVAELFVSTQEAKKPLEKAKCRPVKRRLFQPSRMEDDDEEPKFPHLVFSLPESFAPPSQNKEPVEESKFLPVKSSLAEAFAFAPQAKKPTKEPIFVPVRHLYLDLQHPHPNPRVRLKSRCFIRSSLPWLKLSKSLLKKRFFSRSRPLGLNIQLPHSDP